MTDQQRGILKRYMDEAENNKQARSIPDGERHIWRFLYNLIYIILCILMGKD
jgi:hypothetical protein